MHLFCRFVSGNRLPDFGAGRQRSRGRKVFFCHWRHRSVFTSQRALMWPALWWKTFIKGYFSSFRNWSQELRIVFKVIGRSHVEVKHEINNVEISLRLKSGSAVSHFWALQTTRESVVKKQINDGYGVRNMSPSREPKSDTDEGLEFTAY